MGQDSDFPYYRKYADGMTFFKVISYNKFEELKVKGEKYSLNTHVARIHPDRVLISDMIFMDGEGDKYWEEADMLEYENLKSTCKEKYQKTGL